MNQRTAPAWLGWLSPLLALVAGAGLRLWLVHAHPLVQGDSLLYGDIATNWLRHGVYGHSVSHATGPATVEPTLVRLPGYPAFLAVCFALFGVGNYHAVLYLQAAIDLVTCLLVASFARQIGGPRAGHLALWLAALCPFSASYVAAPLTETLSLFCVALGFLALGKVLRRPGWLWFGLLSFSWSFAALLRPDGALLAVVLWAALIACGRHSLGLASAARFAIAAGLLSLLPSVAWSVRNARTFHVFQPLAPRYANDPGEFAAPGFVRWVRTLSADFTSTSEIYWNGNSDVIDLSNLSARAIDNPAQYAETQQLLADYNAVTTLTPALDARFDQLARERIRAHPLRYYVCLPLLRLADMWFRPRTETWNTQLRWWQFGQHPAETVLAIAYGALNLAYVAVAVAGLLRRPPMAGAMLCMIVLRCLLLATIEAPETRYTLECFPVLWVLGGAAFARRGYLTTRSVPGGASILNTPAAIGAL